MMLYDWARGMVTALHGSGLERLREKEITKLVYPTDGYAVCEAGTIVVESIAPTQRGAIVNWLWTNCKVLITNDMKDHSIFMLWKQHRYTRKAAVIRVRIVNHSVQGITEWNADRLKVEA